MNPWILGDPRSKMILRVFSYYGFIKRVSIDLASMYHWHELVCKCFVSLWYFYNTNFFFGWIHTNVDSFLISHFIFPNPYAHPHMRLIANGSSQLKRQLSTCNRLKNVNCYYGSGLERQLFMFKSTATMAIICRVDFAH